MNKSFTTPLYKFILAVFLSFSSSILLQAQHGEQCATHKDHVYFIGNSPSYAAKYQSMEQQFAQFRQMSQFSRIQNGDTVFVIPVVVHIVWNQTFENISDAQIISQITALNADMRRLNPDTSSNIAPGLRALGGDTRLEFQLARIDPDGRPTNGVIRKSTTRTDFGGVDTPTPTRNDVKRSANGGSDPWPTDKYLNMWICNFISQGGGQLLGYAQFPGLNPATDGVVMWFRAFGSNRYGGPFPVLSGNNNLGRTTTHEVGHWLGLRHIWGDNTACGNPDGSDVGGDGIADTPPQSNSTSGGCPPSPRFDICTPGGDGIMFQNYMDYTPDNCMSIFTNGQVQRMRFVMDNFRSSLKQTAHLAGPSLPLMVTDAAPVLLTNPERITNFCKGDMRPKIFIRNWGSSPLTAVEIGITVNNGTVINTSWTGFLNTYAWTEVELPLVEFNQFGNNSLKIFTRNPNNTADMRSENDTLSIIMNVTPPAATYLPIAQGFETNPFPGNNWVNSSTSGWITHNSGGFGASNRSIVRKIFEDLPDVYGRTDTLQSPNITINNALDSMYLTWNYAYQRRNLSPPSTFTDTLRVMVSVDCGQTWQIVRQRAGASLQTVGSFGTNNAGFVPTATQWANDSADLTPFIAQSSTLRFAVVSVSGRNNNIYIDNLNLTSRQLGPVGFPLESLKENTSFKMYPNPAQSRVTVQHDLLVDREAKLSMYNLSGQALSSFVIRGDASGNAEVELLQMASGMYIIELQTNNQVLRSRLLID